MTIGLKQTSTVEVDSTNTALALGSGDMEVFATLALVALMENAAMLAAAHALPEGSTTVGAQIAVEHLKPSKIGATVAATATLTSVEGRKWTFSIEASDESGLVGRATHVRYEVDRARFLAKLG